MARITPDNDFGPIIEAAQSWMQKCLVEDGSILSTASLWTSEHLGEVRRAFVDHPDEGEDDFRTKLIGQMSPASPEAQQLMAEMLWIILLFPMKINPSTKRKLIGDIWSLSRAEFPESSPLLSDKILAGVGSTGQAYNTMRWRELIFLLKLAEGIKAYSLKDRIDTLSDYDAMMRWMDSVPEDGHRQFRHLIRYFAFPDRVERIASNGDRKDILAEFGVALKGEIDRWTDPQLDDALLALRRRLESEYPGQVLDFYAPPLAERWRRAKASEPDEDERKLGERRYWWVNQGRTYRLAKEGGFIWAPKANQDGKPMFHWDNVARLSPGDIILSNSEKSIRAISIARSGGYDSDRGVMPEDWGKSGTRADLEYFELINQLPVNLITSRLKSLHWQGSPIDKHGRVRQGYLFVLTEEAVRIIFEEIGKDNLPPEIANAIDFELGESTKAAIVEHVLPTILRRYHDDQIIFTSSSRQQRYAISSVDDSGAEVARLDADESYRLTWSHAEKLIERVRLNGSVDFAGLDGTSACRNAVLQAEPLALNPEKNKVLYVGDHPSRLESLLQVIRGLNKNQPLYKPGMLLCVLDGIDSGELPANQITFDWIAPRFIKLLEGLGKKIGEAEAAQPFCHLTGDLIWFHAVHNLRDPMADGREGPAAARRKVKYALLKDTYWNLLQVPQHRAEVRKELEMALGIPAKAALPTDRLLPQAEEAIRGTGFFCHDQLLRRFLCSLAAKPFVILTGNSGTGKTKLAELLAHWMAGDTVNGQPRYTIVPVGADWTDNRNVVGFVNHLRKDAKGRPLYQSTPVLDLLLRAARDRTRPYFLILDEMNLSHVERYFSDFLSAMESKKPVPLHQEQVEMETTSGMPAPCSIGFPDNLYVVGTVNVDETTYMFSPKVLDRANVIEFRISPEQASDFLGKPANTITPMVTNPGATATFLELSHRARGIKGPALPPPDAADMQRCQHALEDLFKLLHRVRLEFAYRTLTEALRYIHTDAALAPGGGWSWSECLDAQIIQKILPKLHGSRRRLEPILVALATYCEKQDMESALKAIKRDATLGNYNPVQSESAAFPLSHGKLIEMLESVRRDQFVSFIQ